MSIGTVNTAAPVRRRHAGSLSWSEIRTSGEIYLKDLVYTPPGVLAEVSLNDGRRVVLPEDSLVQFDDITVSNLEITLREMAQPKRPTFRLIPLPKTKRAVRLEDPTYLQFSLNLLKERVRAVLAHVPKIIVPKKVIPADATSLKQVASYELKLGTPEKGLNLPFSPGEPTLMSWSPVPVPGVSFLVEVATDEKFKSKKAYPTKESSLKVPLEKPGKYYWRVASAGPGGTNVSESSNFSLYPRGSRGVSEAISLDDWDRFLVEVSRTKGFEALITSRGASEPKCPSEGLAPGWYWCRVREGKGKQYAIKTFRFEVKK